MLPTVVFRGQFYRTVGNSSGVGRAVSPLCSIVRAIEGRLDHTCPTPKPLQKFRTTGSFPITTGQESELRSIWNKSRPIKKDFTMKKPLNFGSVWMDSRGRSDTFSGNWGSGEGKQSECKDLCGNIKANPTWSYNVENGSNMEGTQSKEVEFEADLVENGGQRRLSKGPLFHATMRFKCWEALIKSIKKKKL